MTKTRTGTEAVPIDSPSRQPPTSRAKAEAPSTTTTETVKAPTRTDFLIGLMRTEVGETAQQLAEAVGWQGHSVRGFISGTLKKRSDLTVVTTKVDGETRYTVRDVVEAADD